MINIKLPRVFGARSGEANLAERPFGGFWTDHDDALQQLAQKLERSELNLAESETVRHWIEHGFAILPGALTLELVSSTRRAVDQMIDEGTRHMTYWDERGKQQGAARRDKLAAAESKVIDVHAHSAEVQAAIFAPALARFFETVMQDKAIAFQTLYFEYGSEQPVHQDTAFVYVDPPLEFMASWIALEDIEVGSGELVYHPGSHKLPHHLFGQPPGKALLPGDPAMQDYSERLLERCLAAGLQEQKLRIRAGDALVWAADLVHGGSRRDAARALTRRSLVTHYCPAHRRPPYARSADRASPAAHGHFVLSQT